MKAENEFYDAVNYTKDLFKVKDTFKLERTSPFWGLYKAYMLLINELGDYKFMVQWRNSYGHNQNLTNENILLYFTLFEDEMREIILFLDRAYKENGDELDKDIKKYTANAYWPDIEVQAGNLKRAAKEYYYAMEDVSKGEPTSGLSYAKKQWRLQRNSACRSALNFIKWLEDLAVKYNPEFKGDFKDYIKYLRKQPYYFCFIDDHQKNQLEEEKRLRKEQSRQK